jgi:hypothetical protein
VRKFAAMIGKPQEEAQRIYEQYDRELPFLRQLSDFYSRRARTEGYIALYDGARRHFDRFAPGGKWEKGAGPCSREEARERLNDPKHPWYRRGPLYRLDFDDMLVARASRIESNPANGFSAPSLRVVARDADSSQDNAPTVRANPLKTSAEIAAGGMDANITRVTAPGKNDSPGSRAR